MNTIKLPKGEILPLDSKLPKCCKRCQQPFLGFRSQFYCDYCRKELKK